MISLTENIIAIPIPENARGFKRREGGSIVYLHGKGMSNMLAFIQADISQLLGTVNTETGESDGICLWKIRDLMESKGCKGRYAIIKKI